jgi:hypothetical protein
MEVRTAGTTSTDFFGWLESDLQMGKDCVKKLSGYLDKCTLIMGVFGGSWVNLAM